MTNLVKLPFPVAILDEHQLTDEQGRDLGYLSPAKLQRIADNNNRRVELTGDKCPVVLGHTDDDRAEWEQPEIWGESDDYFVSKGAREGDRIVPSRSGHKHYLFCRWYIEEEKIPLLRKFPRRSVELWTGKWEVDPISLLGATTPDRDLGLVRMSASKGQSIKIRFQEHEMFGPDEHQDESTTPLTLAQLQQLPQWQFLDELMAQMEQQQQEQPGLEGQEQIPGEEDQEPVVGGQEGQDDGGEEAPPEEEEGDESPIRHSAGYPGASDTHVPVNERVSMSRDQDHNLKVRLARAEAARESDRQEIQALRVQLARSARKNDLLALENEGIELDVNEELDVVAPHDFEPLDEERYQAYLNKLRKRFRRSPVVKNPIQLSRIGVTGNQIAVSDDTRKARVQKVQAKIVKNPKLDYDAELEAEMNGGGEATR